MPSFVCRVLDLVTVQIRVQKRYSRYSSKLIVGFELNMVLVGIVLFLAVLESPDPDNSSNSNMLKVFVEFQVEFRV